MCTRVSSAWLCRIISSVVWRFTRSRSHFDQIQHVRHPISKQNSSFEVWLIVTRSTNLVRDNFLSRHPPPLSLSASSSSLSLRFLSVISTFPPLTCLPTHLSRCNVCLSCYVAIIKLPLWLILFLEPSPWIAAERQMQKRRQKIGGRLSGWGTKGEKMR